MRKPTCVKCQIGMKFTESGTWCITMFGDPPQPYQIWSSDKYRCPVCSSEILAGYAERPIAEHFQETFDIALEKAMNGSHVIQYEHTKDALEASSSVIV